MESRYASFRSAAVIFYLLLATFATLEPAQAQINCYSERLCQGTLTVVGTIRECCLTSDGLTFDQLGGEPCQTCVVFGWRNGSSSAASERGEAYSLAVGYIKGADRAPGNGRLRFDVTNTPGTATEGASNDYRLSNTQNLNVRPTMDDTVQVTFRVDNVALEPNETLTLTLIPTNTLARALDSHVFLLETIELTIQDSDVVTFQFTESDYRAREQERPPVPVVVERNFRIATNVTLRITPVNFTEVNFTGFPFPEDFPDVPGFDSTRPIIASSLPEDADFSSDPIEVTFFSDEINDSEDIDVPIVVFDDPVNEADEVFVVLLEVVTNVPEGQVNLVPRNVSLYRIVDNDPISIGFELPSYTFVEQFRTFTMESTPVYLIKEGNRASEQTFEIVVTAGPAQDPNVADATPFIDDVTPDPNNPPDYRVPNVQAFIFEPFEDRIPVPFQLFDDLNPELLEGFLLSSSPDEESPPFQSGTNPTTTIAIINNDLLVIGFTETFTRVSEGICQFELCLNITVPDPQVELDLVIFLDLQTEDGTAIEMEDYVRIDFDNNPLEDFSNDLRLQCFNVTIQDDSLFELTEQFSVTAFPFSPDDPVVVNPNVSVVEIVDNDALVIGFTETFTSVSEGIGQFELCLNVTEPSPQVELPANLFIFIELQTENGTAVEMEDYLRIDFDNNPLDDFTNDLRFQCFNVTIQDDSRLEFTERFSVTAFPFSPDDPVVVNPNVSVVEIVDNDSIVGFNPATYTVSESEGSVEVTVELRAGSLVGITAAPVTLSATSLSAQEGVDFSLTTTSLVFSETVTSITVPVNIAMDDLVEFTEMFQLNITLADPSLAGRVMLDPDFATVTILDSNRVVIGFDPDTYTVNEGDGTFDTTIRVLMGELSRPVTVFATSSDGTALADSDYDALSGLLTFSQAETSFIITHTIIDDNIHEPQEFFFGNLSTNDTDVILNPATARVDIIDNDVVSFSFRRPMQILLESVGMGEVCVDKMGQTTETIRVMVTGNLQPGVGVLTEELTFGPDDVEMCVSFNVEDDNIALEDPENLPFTLTILDSQRGVELGRYNRTVVVIVDDDDLFLTLEKPSTLPESVGSVEACIVFSNPFARPFEITALSNNNVTNQSSAEAGADYSVVNMTITTTLADSAAGMVCFSIDITNDNLVEDDEECFAVEISIPGDEPTIMIAVGSATCCIVDDDNVMVGFGSPSVTVSESDRQFMMCVVKNASTIFPVVVTLVNSPISATPGDDYLPATIPQQVTIQPTEDRTCFTGDIVDDSIALEGTESFQIQITTATPAGVIIGLDTTTVFIEDDDVVTVRFEQPTYTATELAVEVCIVKNLETAVTRNITLTTRDGTASSPADYIGGSFPVTIPTEPNARTCQTIVIVEDTEQGQDEFFFVDLPTLSNGIQTGNPDSAQVFIIRDVGELVNDTVVGDPLYTVPIFVPDIENSGLNSSRVSLCYEVHGQANAYFNLVTDECASVNARYHEVADFLNVIDQIGIRAVDNSTTRCRNIAVSLPNCSIEIDGTEFTGNRYRQGGIYIRRYPRRVRVSVPNCQDLTLVMWVFCRTRSLENPFTGDTITTDTIKYEVMRGLNFGHRDAHGLIGQFWNIPVQVTMFTGQLRNGTQAPPGRFVINVTRPNSEPRVFTGCLYDLTWEFQEGPCLYSGNRQAGPIYEVSDPNDGVVEGTYRDYEIPGAFDETDYRFGLFNEDMCTP